MSILEGFLVDQSEIYVTIVLYFFEEWFVFER